jgi:hypothetical protein
MKKILVCAEDGLSIIRIERLLSAKNIDFELSRTPIRRDDLFLYSILIIHTSWRLANIYQFIENAVITKNIPIIYVSPKKTIAPFVNIMNNSFFAIVDEDKIDGELPVTIDLMRKFSSELKKLELENRKIQNQMELEKLMILCKNLLMEEGLSENDAHQLILKQAMNDHISKYDACQKILSKKNHKDID